MKIYHLMFLVMLSGCSAKEYYENQPERDKAETERIEQLAAGYKGIAEAVFGVQQVRTGQHCKNCGGPFVDSRHDPIRINPGGRTPLPPPHQQYNTFAQKQAKDEPSVYIQDQSGKTLEVPISFLAEEPMGGQDQSAPPQYPVANVHNNYSPVQHGQANNETGLLLQYIMAERQAAANQAAAAEKTRQVQLIVDGYTKAVLKKQPQQAAPFTPQRALEVVAENSGILALAGTLGAIASAGIEAAQGHTTATVTDGASLSQGGASSTALKPTTITKTTSHAPSE